MVRTFDIEAKFIVSLIPDGGGNGAWVGTEDHGVYHYDGNAEADKQWKQYKNEPGDPNGYALALDKQGRLWVGTLNHGVSVFNGETWKTYDVIDGPLGERIFDIQVCSVDGDVWIASSGGITRYRTKTDSWKHYTRACGLPEDQASSLAFLRNGDLIIGTQCHGLVLMGRSAQGEYTIASYIGGLMRPTLSLLIQVPSLQDAINLYEKYY